MKRCCPGGRAPGRIGRLTRVARLARRLAVGLVTAVPAGAQVWEVDDLFVVPTGLSAGSEFGRAVAVGDLDGDGLDDLVAGALGHLSSRGAFAIALGDAERTPPSTLFGAFGDHPSEWLGYALALGDFDGDGLDEIAVGAPGRELVVGGQTAAFAGAVRIYSWNGSLVLDQTLTQLVTIDPPESADLFGSRLATGDLNDDGFDDLAVSVPGEDYTFLKTIFLDAGVVQVFFGSAQGLRTDNETTLAQGFEGIAGPPGTGDQFGRALAVGDFDHDGFDDLAIGAPYRDVGAAGNGAGRVHVVYGGVGGPQGAGSQVLVDSLLGSAAEADENFGASLAAGRFDETRFACFTGCYSDLAIGVPGQTVNVGADAGKVVVVYGSPSGVSVVGATTLTQFDASTLPEAGDRFGDSLAAGHLDRRPNLLFDLEDLVVGAPGEDVDGVVDAGMAHLFFGSTDGIGQGPLAAQNLVARPGLGSGPAQGAADFGQSLAVGDLDGDGWGDLLIGVPRQDQPATSNLGGVQGLYGALFADGFESGGSAFWSGGAPARPRGTRRRPRRRPERRPRMLPVTCGAESAHGQVCGTFAGAHSGNQEIR
ncbi:MAG: hypothetical protein F9K16_12370 [Thermoanaerobaculia bacterium]|nr:MAG: hypothetical protein F9K16_12370 [Thermoanaerobaculia bacterium]MBZ0103674.1 VCBS repeat-containing protein [Thermoanaerobaculia bacterium]